MRITFLGTGTSQGVPVIACGCLTCRSQDERDKRLRTSLLIEADDQNIVIDAGPDFRQQMLRADVKSLRSILLTHEHKDHIGGMDDVRAYNYISKEPTDIYSDERVQEAIKRTYPYVFAENKYPGVPQMNLITIGDEPFRAGSLEVVPV
ncbi:MAG: MBL fold metallo-hydrolase, partial [Bacteroidales bacterium]